MLWRPSGKVKVLDAPEPGSYAEATDINVYGASVGHIAGVGDSKTAMYWSPTGKATDLQTILGPSWSDTSAKGINNAGDIVGNGFYNGNPEAFELLWSSGGADTTSGHYINASPEGHSALAASALFATPHSYGSVGSRPGLI